MSEHCDDALANIYNYLDRELEGDTASVIRGHLEDCPPCEHAFAFEDRLKMVIRQRLEVEVPSEFLNRLRQALRSERT
ncbi:MAG: zf-HC2 domain-containing protein [Acidimicrobiia bacterium]|nr:zf-HC2 domain-containing protein [Acidimicrobiia bacterium]